LSLPGGYKAPASAKVDWSSLGFSYYPTNCYMALQHKDGKWATKPTVHYESTVTMHITSNALHYGQAVFEGLKAFHCKDGKVRAFASTENALRLNRGANRLYMPEVPIQVFNDICDETIRLNAEFVPPYGSNGAMYMR
jgi:branched-chain amino acid aminotransferase